MMRSCRKSRENSTGKRLNFMMFVEVILVLLNCFDEERRRCSLLCCSERTDGFVCVMSLFISLLYTSDAADE